MNFKQGNQFIDQPLNIKWILTGIPLFIFFLINIYLNSSNSNFYDQHALSKLTFIFKINQALEELQTGLAQTIYLEKEIYDVQPKLQKFYNESILAFVSPWNENGYNYTLQYAHKIDMVAPIWYTIKFSNGIPWIDGSQYVNDEYMDAMREKNSSIKIVPRLFLEDIDNFITLVDSGKQEYLIQKIMNTYQEYDGIVFDSHLTTYSINYGVNMTNFLGLLSRKLKNQNEDFVFLTTLQGYDTAFSWTTTFIEEILQLSDNVLVQTYDYPKAVANFKPLSPMNWVKSNIYYFEQFTDFNKIMLGIPFFGYLTYMNETFSYINGEDLMKLDTKSHLTDLQWNNQYKECVIYLRKEGLQYHYPCLKFIEARLNEFQKYKLGFFIWDGGQGLKQFYEIML